MADVRWRKARLHRVRNAADAKPADTRFSHASRAPGGGDSLHRPLRPRPRIAIVAAIGGLPVSRPRDDNPNERTSLLRNQ